MGTLAGFFNPSRRARLAAALRPVWGLLLVGAIFYAIPPHYGINADQLRTILVQTVVVAVAAMGMTIVIVSGGIDLSVGSAAALAGVAVAISLDRGASAPVAVLVALATGAVCGLYNGLLITVLRLPAFIATLGTLGFFRGVAKWISDSGPISPRELHGLNNLLQPTLPPSMRWMIVAPGVWLMLALSIAVAAVLRSTVFGRHNFAVGGNETAARYSGIRIDRLKILTYTVAGVFVGLAGLLRFARLRQGDPTVDVGLELHVIAAVVIGGASLSGGQGSIAGTLAGALMMAFLKNRCAVLGFSSYVEEMIVGHIIIAAVALDQSRSKRARG